MRKVIEQLVDDISGEPIGAGEGSTLTFALEGSTYEIDLTHENANALRGALEPYITVARARRGGASAGQPRATSRGTGRVRATSGPWSAGYATVREWAQSQGITVSERGRVANEVMQAYEDAHK